MNDDQDFIKSYLSRFSYVDWTIGDDDCLRLGDHIMLDYQDYSIVDVERNIPARIGTHPDLMMPILFINEEIQYSEDSRDYVSLEQAYLDGWTFIRISKKEFIEETLNSIQ